MTRNSEMNMTFRQLVEKVAREGMPVDKHRSNVSLHKLCKVSRPLFYNALLGTKRLSEIAVKKLAKGLSTVAPWVTEEIVQAAVLRSRAMKSNEKELA